MISSSIGSWHPNVGRTFFNKVLFLVFLFFLSFFLDFSTAAAAAAALYSSACVLSHSPGRRHVEFVATQKRRLGHVSKKTGIERFLFDGIWRHPRPSGTRLECPIFSTKFIFPIGE